MMEPHSISLAREPTIKRRSLVAWAGYRSGVSVESMDRTVIGSVATPLTHAAANSTLLAAALKEQMGVVLPSQGWRNQLERTDKKRLGGFANLSVSRPAIVLRPDEQRYRTSFAERYSADHLEGELSAGATIATTPGHVLAEECAIGRENELLLARLSAEEFAARRGSAPAPGQPATARRALYATIMLQGEHAKHPEIVARLLAEYEALEGVSGYWIIATNCNQSGVQLAGYARLALGLQAATGRATVCSGVGDTHLALLASGVAATCVGLHGMTFTFPPAPLPEPDPESEEDPPGLGIPVYHRTILGNVGAPGADGANARRAIFRNQPCPCGHHQADEPPERRQATVRHNAWSVSADAGELARPTVADAERLLRARAETAARTRTFLKLGKLKPGFASVAPAAAAVRDAGSAATDSSG
jgi:hypothetical protein